MLGAKLRLICNIRIFMQKKCNAKEAIVSFHRRRRRRYAGELSPANFSFIVVVADGNGYGDGGGGGDDGGKRFEI